MAQAFVDVANLKAKQNESKRFTNSNETNSIDNDNNAKKRKLSVELNDPISLATKHISKINNVFEDLESSIKSSVTCLSQIKILKHEVSNKLKTFLLFVIQKEFGEDISNRKSDNVSLNQDIESINSEIINDEDFEMDQTVNSGCVTTKSCTPFQMALLNYLSKSIIPKEINYDESFLMSLLPFFQKMNDDQKLDTRLHVLKIIRNVSKINTASQTTQHTSSISTPNHTTYSTSPNDITSLITSQSITSTTTPQHTPYTSTPLCTITMTTTSSQCTTASSSPKRTTITTSSQCTTASSSPKRTTTTTSSRCLTTITPQSIKTTTTPQSTKITTTPQSTKATTTPQPTKATITPQPTKATTTSQLTKATTTPQPTKATTTPQPTKATITPQPTKVTITPQSTKATTTSQLTKATTSAQPTKHTTTSQSTKATTSPQPTKATTSPKLTTSTTTSNYSPVTTTSLLKSIKAIPTTRVNYPSRSNSSQSQYSTFQNPRRYPSPYSRSKPFPFNQRFP